MTDPAAGLFAVPLGCDFPAALVAGLIERFGRDAPEALARVTVYLNSPRMLRRVRADLIARDALLHPRLRLVTDLGRGLVPVPTVPPLRRRLELRQLVRQLIDAQPDIAPPAAAFDLAGSLLRLLAEMQEEAVTLSDISAIDVSDQSGHWARSQSFLALLDRYLATQAETGLTPEAAWRRGAEALVQGWRDTAPRDPIVIAGSTGSRGTTRLLMQAVAAQPGCAVVLPGVDRDQPEAIWDRLTGASAPEDHPQSRFAKLAAGCGTAVPDIPDWTDTPRRAPGRAALVSMALRPAPVTDGWLTDGPGLGDLGAATRDLTLIEAPDPRAEAAALALCLRAAVERGHRSALISPDRTLTRRVTAALARWNIRPDDSAGEPLRQTPAGRLIRHVAALAGHPLTPEGLVVVLKHPLVAGPGGRGAHLLATRELERHLRREGIGFVTAEVIRDWAQRTRASVPAGWAGWAAGLVGLETGIGAAPLPDHLGKLVGGLTALDPGGAPDLAVLGTAGDGLSARAALTLLQTEGAAGGTVDETEFRAILDGALDGEVRDATAAHPDVMILGTLEARVQNADLVLLAGLNDTVWPELPAPDPWLNRTMRRACGLRAPDRQVGLAAHDFQQAIMAPQVVLSRSKRDAEAPTVPSRWLNRLLNLIAGLPDQGGQAARDAMSDRGMGWLALAADIDRPSGQPATPAPRPAPCPPVAARPVTLSVTEVETLIRDPYEIYAKRTLALSPLAPLRRGPDALLRGNVLHRVFEIFVPGFAAIADADRRDALLAAADATLARDVPWPAARRLWRARLARIAGSYLADEAQRHRVATPIAFEVRGQMTVPGHRLLLKAKADRLDRDTDGGLRIYDYKTGAPPTARQQDQFAKQLPLEVAIARAGGFEGLPAATVTGAAYIGLGAAPGETQGVSDPDGVDAVLAGLAALLAHYDDPDTGYAANLARQSARQSGSYDHLSRAGEWALDTSATRLKVGP